MSGFSSRVRWSDGEAIDMADTEQAQNFILRQMVDEFLVAHAGPDDIIIAGPTAAAITGHTATTSVRTHRNALCCRVNNGMVLKFDPGFVVHRKVATAPSAASTSPEHLACYTAPLSATIGAAHATLYRRDLVQVRLVTSDAATESRDFKDAVTYALSSQTTLKRTNVVCEVSVKASSTYASAALADANEPTPDAGYERLASVLVPPTATLLDQQYVWDWRKPFGFGRCIIHPANWAYDSGWALGYDAATVHYKPNISAAGGDKASCFPMHGMGAPQALYMRGGPGTAGAEEHRRLALMRFYGKRGNSPTFSLNCYDFFNHDVYAGPALDMPTRIGTSDGENVLYQSVDAGLGSPPNTDPPIWANGCHSPAYAGTGSVTATSAHGMNTVLYFYVEAGGVGSDIMTLASAFWGGL